MTSPNGYIPVDSAAIHDAGLADQPMLYWREDWEAPRVLRLSDSECPQWAMGAYVRGCKALREAMADYQTKATEALKRQFSDYAAQEAQLQALYAATPLGLGLDRPQGFWSSSTDRAMQRSTGWLGGWPAR